MMLMNKAIVFDLDGVIIQSEIPTFHLLQKIIKKYGYTLDDSTYIKRIGKKMKIFLNEIYEDSLSEDAKNAILEDFYHEYVNNTLEYISPIPKTVNFIKKYKGDVKLGLASVSSRSEIDKILHNLTIYSCFDVITSSDDVTHLKPHPEIYLKAAERLGFLPQLCCALEDSLVGAQSASSAQFQTYIFLNGINKKEDFTGSVLNGFVQSEQDMYHLVNQ